jgi:hypothetical protein
MGSKSAASLCALWKAPWEGHRPAAKALKGRLAVDMGALAAAQTLLPPSPPSWTATPQRPLRTAGDCPEALLPRSVPNLQLDPFVVEEDLFDLEIDPVERAQRRGGRQRPMERRAWTSCPPARGRRCHQAACRAPAAAVHIAVPLLLLTQCVPVLGHPCGQVGAPQQRALPAAANAQGAPRPAPHIGGRRSAYPMVVMKLGVKLSSENRSSRQLLPTPASQERGVQLANAARRPQSRPCAPMSSPLSPISSSLIRKS